jgi:hypothetical protein
LKRALARRRQAGALLLVVALTLATIAALAVGLNRAAAMDSQAVGADYDRRSAAYLAEGALAAATWANQSTKCGVVAPLPTFTLAGGTLGATVAKAPSKKINVVATAVAAGGASVTLSRTEVPIVDFNASETKDLGGSVRDTYIAYGGLTPVMLSNSLVLTSGQSHALLYWPTTDIPPNALVLSARMILTQNGSSGTARSVNVHRMTSPWDTSAIWKAAFTSLLGNTNWLSTTTLLGSDGGGDFSTPVLAATKVSGAGAYSWDVTGLVDGWYNGRLRNYGLLMRLPDPGQTATFYSMEASSSLRPVLRVTFAKQC